MYAYITRYQISDKFHFTSKYLLERGVVLPPE